MSFELRGMNASKKAPLEAGLRVLGDSNSAIACQLGAALLWRITGAARWRTRGSGKIGESTGKIGADDGNRVAADTSAFFFLTAPCRSAQVCA
jgi:hypothetical protein